MLSSICATDSSTCSALDRSATPAHCAVRTSAAFAAQLCGDFFDQLACVCACLDCLGAADCQHAGFALVGRCKHSNHVWSIRFDLVAQGAQAVRSGVLEDCMDIAYTLDRNGVGKQFLYLAVGNLCLERFNLAGLCFEFLCNRLYLGNNLCLTGSLQLGSNCAVTCSALSSSSSTPIPVAASIRLTPAATEDSETILNTPI